MRENLRTEVLEILNDPASLINEMAKDPEEPTEDIADRICSDCGLDIFADDPDADECEEQIKTIVEEWRTLHSIS